MILRRSTLWLTKQYLLMCILGHVCKNWGHHTFIAINVGPSSFPFAVLPSACCYPCCILLCADNRPSFCLPYSLLLTIDLTRTGFELSHI